VAMCRGTLGEYTPESAVEVEEVWEATWAEPGHQLENKDSHGSKRRLEGDGERACSYNSTCRQNERQDSRCARPDTS